MRGRQQGRQLEMASTLGKTPKTNVLIPAALGLQ
jgi:hypothetical protein